MTPEEFRTAGYRLIDWITEYRNSIESRPVRAQVAPGEVRNRFPETPPDSAVEFDALLKSMTDDILPGITQVQHPMHFGWFPSNASLESVLGDVASSGLGTLGISWESCPALTEVEEVMCDWMRQLVGLSGQWEGTIHDTASTACLTALLLARERSTAYCQNREGLQGHDKPLMVYLTGESHSSVMKSALLAGFGERNIRTVPVDPVTRAMIPEALSDQMRSDRSAGCQPCVIVATVGTTGVTAIDPVDSIADIAKEYGLWVHVDAALAGTAMLLPECRYLWSGVEETDSLSWNAHKWMGTVLDCSLFYVRNPEHLIRVMSTNPSYLRSTVDGAVTQYRDWGIPLGRRFRALKLLFQLQLEGMDSIRARLRRDLANAKWLGEQVEKEENWKVLVPYALQTVCIRHEPPGLTGEALDAYTRSWAEAVNHSGRAFLSPAKMEDRWFVRVSIGVQATTRTHVEELWRLIRKTAKEKSPPQSA